MVANINFQLAQTFLSLLDPHATEFFFQTVGQGNAEGDPSLTRTFYGSLLELSRCLAILNEQGAGVFVCINRLTDGATS